MHTFRAVHGLVLALLALLSTVACASPSPAPAAPPAAAPPKAEQPAAAAKAPAPAATSAPAAAPAAAAAAAPAKQPKRGGSLREAKAILVGTLDPLFYQTASEVSYGWPAYNALVENDPIDVDKLGPGLADSWTLSPDGLNYTFKLHPGIKFHNGQPFTSADVKYTYDTVMKPPAGQVSRRKAAFVAVDSVSAPDDMTVTVKMKYPSAAFLPGIASIPIVPREAHSKGPFLTTAIGTGPFKFVSYQKDVEIVYRRNEDYWRKGLPYLDELHFLLITDDQAAIQAVRTGRADDVEAVGEAGRKIFKEQYADSIRLVNFKRLNVGLVYFNHTQKDKPWADKRVRQAISTAIDRQEYLNAVWGGQGDIIGMIPDVGGWALPADELKKYAGYSGDKATRVAQAKKLLADAGYANGFKVSAVASTGYLGDMALFVQAALKPIGIDLAIQSMDLPSVSKKRTDADFDLLVDSLPTSLPDPDEQLSPFVTGQTLNYGRYSNPKIDDMYQQQSRTVDEAKRKVLVLDMQRLLMDEMPIVMLQGRVDTVAEQKYVSDHKLTPAFHWHFSRSMERVWLDK